MPKFRVWDTAAEGHMPKNLFQSCTFDLVGHVVEVYGSDTTVLAQYTGVVDKSGQEIFEGDVVRFADHIGTVTFERGSFFIGDEPIAGQKPEKLQVIGNIYMNPELA